MALAYNGTDSLNEVLAKLGYSKVIHVWSNGLRSAAILREGGAAYGIAFDGTADDTWRWLRATGLITDRAPEPEPEPAPKPVKQCKTCPWKASVVPSRDVPDYGPGIYDRMRSSSRSGIESMREATRIVMECHVGKRRNRPCAGWLYYQIGDGNNLAMRLAVMVGRLPNPQVSGEQIDISQLGQDDE